MKPIIIATWKFGENACRAGWEILSRNGLALDAVEAAANVTELDTEVQSVGYGGLPNAICQTELDAAIMDGRTHSAGSVGAVKTVRCPISVARRVMETLPHVMLVGENAERFALENGFPIEDTLTESAKKSWEKWNEEKGKSEVAHFGSNPIHGTLPVFLTSDNHDTIGICALDSRGDLAVACTTSGMAWKTPGRIGDSPIIGSGLYLDNDIGAAAGTGHGDEMMKTCVSYRAVMNMERGMTPEEACVESLRYLLKKRPTDTHGHYGAALVAVNKEGVTGGAATQSGFLTPDNLWHYAVTNETGTMLYEGPYVTPTEVFRGL